MLTIDWLDFQHRKPKNKKKLNHRNTYQVKEIQYQLDKKNFSSSDWKKYKDWIKEKKKLQEKVQNRSKSSNGATIPPKTNKRTGEPKKPFKLKVLYHQQLKESQWNDLRLVIMRRDGYQCRLCGSRHDLQVHHIRYTKGKKAWEYPTSDLITLCRDCHEMVHTDSKHELNPYNKSNS